MLFRKYILAAAVLALAACGGKEKPSSAEQLSVSPASLSFKADGADTYAVTVSASGAWSASATEAWIHFTPPSGTGNGTLNVSVPRSETDARAGRILVKSADLTREVFVSQAAGQAASVALVPAPAAFDGNKRSSTTYQLLIYSFADSDADGIGDFKGIRDRLDYLDDLGVTALWLSPAHPAGSYHAYDVQDYFSLNPLYASGSHTAEKAEADFRELLDAARARNISIYMDYVLNHSGDANAWFSQAVYDSGSPYRAYYIFSSDPRSDVAAGKIPMLASEGSGAYREGEWYACGGRGRYHFHLDWDSDASVRITVNPTDEEPYSGTSGKYLYFGNGEIREFKSSGGTAYDLVTDFESLWGYLVRTSKTTWSAGTKYGVLGRPKVTLGEAVPLVRSSSAEDPANIALSGYYHAHFAQSMPDLNYGPLAHAGLSPAFQALALSADKWLQMGVDGFRLDAVKHIYHNPLSEENPTFLKLWYDRCNGSFDRGEIFMVGEVLDSHEMEKIYYKGLPSLFEFGFRDQVLSCLKNGSGSHFARSIIHFIREHKGFNTQAQTSLIIGNHDISRVASELGRNEAMIRQAAAMLLSAEGKPFVFQGDELGYWGDKTRHGDEDIRMPVLWDKAGKEMARNGLPNRCDGYTDMLTGAISVESQAADEQSLLNVYRNWNRLRNTYPALAEGEMSQTTLAGSSIASWYMTSGAQKLLVIHNVAGSQKELKVTDSMERPIALLGTGSIRGQTLVLGGNSSVIFEL